MSHAAENQVGESSDAGPLHQPEQSAETLGEVLEKAGFETAKVARRIMPQGIPRETLKRSPRVPKNKDGA